jgi:O-antigen/teichoic acid export membrane protein
LGYYAVIDNLVTILFGNNLEMAKSVSFVISLNYFIKFMRQTVELFKDSSGTFYYDRWKPLIEGTVNVILSILFVLWFGVVGVIAATVITTLLINHIVEPYVLYKHALEMPVKSYYIKNYSYIAIFTVALVGLHFCMVDIENQWLELLVNGGISLAFSFVICTIAILINKDFRHYIKVFIGRFKDNFKHKKI